MDECPYPDEVNFSYLKENGFKKYSDGMWCKWSAEHIGRRENHKNERLVIEFRSMYKKVGRDRFIRMASPLYRNMRKEAGD